jgi:L-ascorbate metabolism protein UlaG (beta-lactamase superfamily)
MPPACIARYLGISKATVNRVLSRAGLSRLADLAPAEPVMRYEQAHTGDLIHLDETTLFGDMRLIGDYYKPDLALVPIGGHFVMHPKEAALATKDYVKPKFAIPIHYGTIPQLKGTPAEYTKALGQTSTKVLSINPGDKVDF